MTVAVTMVAIAVPTALSVRAQQARTEALRALPGVLTPMPSAPEVLWTSAGLSVQLIPHASVALPGSGTTSW